MIMRLRCECRNGFAHPSGVMVGPTSRRRRAVSPTHMHAAPIPRLQSYKLVNRVAVCWWCVLAGHVDTAS